MNEHREVMGKSDSAITKRTGFLILVWIAWFCLHAAAGPRKIAPIVSTEWLAQNLGASGLVIVDIRSADQFKKGHIPGSVSAPLSTWIVHSNELTLELPSDQAIADRLGSIGIRDTTSSSILIVNRMDTDFGRADTTRVAWTCMVAGLIHVAILDGGYTKWLKENKPISTESTLPVPAIYSGSFNRFSIATRSHVLSRLDAAIILDTRIPEDYFGITSKPGHIKGALNLPTPWVFSSDGTFKNEADLQAMAHGVLGIGASQKEVLIYCGVGGYAATWWFLLSQVFDYANVKLYDGSMEEWIKNPEAPVRTYSWR